MKFIDDFLNSNTMYRLMLYVLVCFLILALGFSFIGLLPFKPLNLFFSVTILTFGCWIANYIFAKFFNAPTNAESVYITAWILSLIITPINSVSQLPLLIIVAILASASKFIFAINKKHIFNPSASAVFISGLLLKFGASWWIGNPYMLIPVLIGGVFIVKKVRRFSLVLSFFIIYLLIISGQSVLSGTGLQFLPTLLESPVFFFMFIMLTEPQTTPPSKNLQILYGGLVGILAPFLSLEGSLLLGNTFSYVVSPKEKLFLKLKDEIKIAQDTYDFVFKLDKPLKYNAGQYMEWTLSSGKPDLRGNRRFFTLASSPTEDTLRLGIKTYANGSSFKKSLLIMNNGDQIIASQLSGEFNLPKDPTERLCFIAGGIGITPFRSMIKYLLDREEKRDIVLFYSNKTEKEIAYIDIFSEAYLKLGIKTVYVNTDTMGYINKDLIEKQVPDFKDRMFYISGPHSMVDAFEKILKGMGVKKIKTDFFPGYA